MVPSQQILVATFILIVIAPVATAARFGTLEAELTSDVESLPVEKTKVIAIRHGQSLWNSRVANYRGIAKKLWQGQEGLSPHWTDSPLSRLGLVQGLRAAKVVVAAKKLRDGETAQDEYFRKSGSDKTAAAQISLEKSSGRSAPLIGTSVEDQVKALVEDHPDALKILLGEACGDNGEDTLLVTSNLIRAIDTALLLTLPLVASGQCKDMKRRVSSNLQETEHNTDCFSRTPVHQRPSMRGGDESTRQQNQAYTSAGMLAYHDYVEEMYGLFNASGFTENPAVRFRYFTALNNGRLDAEMRHLFENEVARNHIWGIHSIWIRGLLKRYANPNDAVCRKAATTKIMNSAMIMFNMVRLKWKTEGKSELKYQIQDCRLVYLDLEEKGLTWARPAAQQPKV